MRTIINSFNNSNSSDEIMTYLLPLSILIIVSSITKWLVDITKTVMKSKNEEKSKLIVMENFIKHRLSEYETGDFQQKLRLVRFGLHNLIDNFFVLLRGVISSVIKVVALLTAITMLNNILLLFLFIALIIPISIIKGYINRSELLMNWMNSYDVIKSSYYKGLLLDSRLVPELLINRSTEFLFGKWNFHMNEINQRDFKNGIKELNLNLVLGICLAIAITIYIVFLAFSDDVSSNPGDLFLAITGVIIIISCSESIFSQIQMIGFQSKRYMMFNDFFMSDNIEEFKQLNSNQSNSKTTLEVKNLSYTFQSNNKPVIKDITLLISAGEKIAVVGPNGAGKTTLYNCIMGLLKPTSGEVIVNGCDPFYLSPEDRARCFSAVLQSTQLYKGISVMDNIILGRNTNKILISEFIENKNYSDLYGGDLGGIELSGGQIQKIGILKGLLGSGTLILDEPTAALDPLAEQEIVTKLLSHAKDRTVILTTHRMGITVQFDRVIVLNEGRVVQDGSPFELLKVEGLFRDMFEKQGQIYKELSEVD